MNRGERGLLAVSSEPGRGKKLIEGKRPTSFSIRENQSPPQSAGTAFLSFRNNPAAELSSKAEQRRRQSVLIRVNPWAKLFPLQSTQLDSLTAQWLDGGNGEEVSQNLRLPSSFCENPISISGNRALSLPKNPATELSSEAEQRRRQSVLIRVNPWAKLFPLQSTQLDSLTAQWLDGGNGEEVSQNLRLPSSIRANPISISGNRALIFPK